MANSLDWLRVGIFSNAYRPLISGVVNSIDLTRQELLRQGHRPWVFAPRVKGYRDRHAGVVRFPSLELTREVQYPLPVPFWPPIHQRLRRTRLDILHAHHPVLLGDYAWYWARRKRVPLVYTFHTQYEQYVHYARLPQAPLRALTRWWVAQFARRCDLILAPSPSIRELLVSYGIRNWTVTLENAIDLSRFQQPQERSRLRLRLGWPQDAVVALYAGRLGKEKNLEYLLEAFFQVQRRHPQALCVILGDGPRQQTLQNLASERGMASQVLFPGRVAYADTPSYFRAADFFTISSTTEVKPLVVLEALASGLPVLAVSACGTADTLTHQHDGLLTPLEGGDFVEGWNYLIEQPERRAQMARAARESAARFSIESYTTRLIELYREARQRLR